MVLIVPAFTGGDYFMGLFILEDLGDHRSLVEPLLKEDAASAERALLRFSARLGAVHAATIGHSAQFERLFTAISPKVWAYAQDVPNVDERVKQLQAVSTASAFAPTPPKPETLKRSSTQLRTRGRFFRISTAIRALTTSS